MKSHLPWIRATAVAVLVAGAGVQEAAAQYAPYRPIPPQPAAPAAAAPVAPTPYVLGTQSAQAPATQNPYSPTVYSAYRTPASYPQAQYQAAPTPQPTPAYGSPTGAQYTQPTAAYSQYPQTGGAYPQTAGQYPQTPTQQYPTTYGASPYAAYVAQQPAPEMPMPTKPMNTSAAQPSTRGAMPTPADKNMPANYPNTNNTNTSTARPSGQQGACGCNAATYGAGEYFTAPGCGCAATGGYPNCGASNYFGDNGCNENQWFGGVYFLEMGRTNSSQVRLTSQMPTGGAYPYYPQPDATIMTTHDVDFGFREGVEVRVGSTFTIGEASSACQSSCGYNTGCGCNSCAPPTTYAWEVAWWGLNSSPDDAMVSFNGTDRIYGMKSYVGLDYNSGTVNAYYDYEMPITAPPVPSSGDVRVVSQRVRTDFKAENLELNVIRFPMCNTGCSGGGYDACGCNSNCTGCNGGCDTGMAFSMYGSCGVRYFHVNDDFLYGSESETYNGATWDANPWLNNTINVKNDLVGPQVGWTNDYCWGKWNLFLNSTFGIFDNHSSVWQRVQDENGTWATFHQSSSNMNVRSNKDSVAFLGELRLGAAYDFTCHWRGVIGYRAVAISGLATAAEQLQNSYTDRSTVGLIDSDNSVIVHGAQVGAECRY
jgi:hypothetical protein